MAFFKRFLKPQPRPPPVPARLPNIKAPTAAQITQSSQPSPAAQQLLTPQQTPSQYLAALQEQRLGNDMVKTLAYGMADRHGVTWAVQSAQTVSSKNSPADNAACEAANAWVKNPTPATQQLAAAAAAKTNYQGPGAWAAQAAAWSQPASPAAASGAATPAVAMPSQRLAPVAVAGAVLLSAAMAANRLPAVPNTPSPASPPSAPTTPTLSMPQAPQMPQVPTIPQVPQAAPPPEPPLTPEEQEQAFPEQQPFIVNGLTIASGQGG